MAELTHGPPLLVQCPVTWLSSQQLIVPGTVVDCLGLKPTPVVKITYGPNLLRLSRRGRR